MTGAMILTQATQLFRQTTPLQAQYLLALFTEQALAGSLVWRNNISQTLTDTILQIEEIINAQLHTIVNHADFLQLEGHWRGLTYLVNQVQPNQQIQVRCMHVTKFELAQHMARKGSYDQSHLFTLIYEQEFGMSGGQPYSLLVADYSFNHHSADLQLLQQLAQIGAMSFCPVITAADPSLFGIDDWAAINKPRSLENIFMLPEYHAWRNFRKSEEACFITMTLPRVLARKNHNDGTTDTAPCWMNAAYTLAARISIAMRVTGWPVTIRGAESGGKVMQLPIMNCAATDAAITDRREAELGKLGFIPLCHYKNTDYAVFFGSQTLQQSKQYDNANATANAAIAARLPYLLATSRIAHYLKVMARDKIGSFLEIQEAERWLNQWILQYVNGNPESTQALKAKYPLAHAQVTLEEVPGNPGSYNAIAWLRPWLQFEELTTSLRLVAHIPKLD